MSATLMDIIDLPNSGYDQKQKIQTIASLKKLDNDRWTRQRQGKRERGKE